MNGEVRIGEVAFGYIMVNGIEHGDVYIFPDGRIEPRDRAAVREKYGTSHIVDAQEIEKLVEGNPSVLIIATGFSGGLKVTEDAKMLCQRRGVHLFEVHTPNFRKAFEDHPGPKAALVHVTC